MTASVILRYFGFSVESPVSEERLNIRLSATEVEPHLLGIHGSHSFQYVLPE
jgi:hypothetical protein